MAKVPDIVIGVDEQFLAELRAIAAQLDRISGIPQPSSTVREAMKTASEFAVLAAAARAPQSISRRSLLFWWKR